MNVALDLKDGWLGAINMIQRKYIMEAGREVDHIVMHQDHYNDFKGFTESLCTYKCGGSGPNMVYGIKVLESPNMPIGVVLVG
jgi:hypothetical protein